MDKSTQIYIMDLFNAQSSDEVIQYNGEYFFIQRKYGRTQAPCIIALIGENLYNELREQAQTQMENLGEYRENVVMNTPENNKYAIQLIFTTENDRRELRRHLKQDRKAQILYSWLYNEYVYDNFNLPSKENDIRHKVITQAIDNFFKTCNGLALLTFASNYFNYKDICITVKGDSTITKQLKEYTSLIFKRFLKANNY